MAQFGVQTALTMNQNNFVWYIREIQISVNLVIQDNSLTVFQNIKFDENVTIKNYTIYFIQFFKGNKYPTNSSRIKISGISNALSFSFIHDDLECAPTSETFGALTITHNNDDTIWTSGRFIAN
jgi:hypothetical protein